MEVNPRPLKNASRTIAALAVAVGLSACASVPVPPEVIRVQALGRAMAQRGTCADAVQTVRNDLKGKS